MPNDTSCPGSAQEVSSAFSGAPAQSVAAVPGALEACGPSCPNVGSGTSLAQTAFARRVPRSPSPRCRVSGCQDACEPGGDAEPQDVYAAFALGAFQSSASSSDDSRRSSALSHLHAQEVPQYPQADVRIADVRVVVGNGVPGPVPFTIFDVVRTVSSDSFDPRSGVHDAVGRAIAGAPFAPVAWHFPTIEVAPFPGPQILLCRYFEQRTVIVDLRDCSLGLHVVEIDRAVDPLSLLRPDLQTHLGPRVRSRAVQATLNGGSWNFGFTRWLHNGDVVVWRPIPMSAILVPQGLRVPRGIARSLHDVYPLFATLTLSSSGRPTTTVLLESYNLAAALDAARTRHILQPHVQMAAGQLDRVVCSRVQPQPDSRRLVIHCLTYSSSVRSPTILLDLRALGGAFGAVVSNALLHLDQVFTGIQCFVNGVLRRHPTPVFNGDLVVFLPSGDHPAPTVATHTLWPLFQALNFVSAPCPVPRATLAEALAGPTVGVVAWGRQLRDRARAETEGGHSEVLIFTPAGVLRAAISDTPPTAARVADALGSVLADLLGAGTVSDVQRAFGDRSVFIFRPDALDMRLTIAIRQEGGFLLAMVLSRPEYMTSGTFFATSHSISADEQAHVDSGSVPVLWPDATGSLDFYNEHDEPSAEPASGSRGYPAFVRDSGEVIGYGGYAAPEGYSSDDRDEDDAETDADAAVVAETSESEPGPEEPAAEGIGTTTDIGAHDVVAHGGAGTSTISDVGIGSLPLADAEAHRAAANDPAGGLTASGSARALLTPDFDPGSDPDGAPDGSTAAVRVQGPYHCRSCRCTHTTWQKTSLGRQYPLQRIGWCWSGGP